ncbi:MAG: RNA methyltransferase [Granulosicoccus sp.]
MSLEIIFVLVGTTHTGNLGAAARAMKTMGFDKLRLVNCCSHKTEEAKARSSGANDVLENALVCKDLDAAIADCVAVIGTSARARQLSVPMLSCREIGAELAALAAETEQARKVAMVFGQERSGLDNDALDRCTRQLRIPCNPDFSSLNLGSAVQVVAYELSQSLNAVPLSAPLPGPGKWKASNDASINAEAQEKTDFSSQPVSSEAMQLFFEHLDRVMIDTGFLNPDNPRHLQRRVRRYFEANRPNESELSIFRGILTAIEHPKRR